MINIAFCKSASLSKMELKGEKKQGGREKAFINKKQINFNQMIRRKAKHINTPTHTAQKCLKCIKCKTKGSC